MKVISPNLQPSNEQLEALIEAVAIEARKHAETARQQLMIRLRAEIATINPFSRAGMTDGEKPRLLS